nr:hypothetical protein [Treponemataceae bacterium]
ILFLLASFAYAEDSTNLLKKNIAFNNFDAVIYPVPGNTEKALIIVSGSEGGLEYAEKMAEYFQSHSIPSLAVGYFKTKHSVKHLSKIPVETIGDAISFLKHLGYEKIGILGLSKGSELAMAAAINYPAISCVIVRTPSYFYTEGLKGSKSSKTSCWTYKDKELPYTPNKIRKAHPVLSFFKNKEFNILKVNSDKDVREDSIIPVEKIKGPVLIMSTKADTIWPSAESGEKIAKRLADKNFPYKYKHICFEHMSHFMFENCGSEIKYLFKSEKEFPGECAEERLLMGEETLNWLYQVW